MNIDPLRWTRESSSKHQQWNASWVDTGCSSHSPSSAQGVGWKARVCC